MDVPSIHSFIISLYNSFVDYY